MFSSKFYVKYKGSDIDEETSDAGDFLGTYTVVAPCSIFLDEELKKEVGLHTITLKWLTKEQISPDYIYMLVMSHFSDTHHIS